MQLTREEQETVIRGKAASHEWEPVTIEAEPATLFCVTIQEPKSFCCRIVDL
jgi:hypothetical protein